MHLRPSSVRQQDLPDPGCRVHGCVHLIREHFIGSSLAITRQAFFFCRFVHVLIVAMICSSSHCGANLFFLFLILHLWGLAWARLLSTKTDSFTAAVTSFYTYYTNVFPTWQIMSPPSIKIRHTSFVNVWEAQPSIVATVLSLLPKPDIWRENTQHGVDSQPLQHPAAMIITIIIWSAFLPIVTLSDIFLCATINIKQVINNSRS